MRTPLLMSPAFLVLAACLNASPAEEQAVFAAPPVLERVWAVTGLDEPEGVTTDGTSFYVSSIDGDPLEKDGEGYITRISRTGEAELWAKGLDAPKGMAVAKGQLYVADIDRIARFDLSTGERGPDIPIGDAGFLNDLAWWKDHLFGSDSARGLIYKINEDRAEVWAEDPRLATVNGLAPAGDSLVFGSSSSGLVGSLTADGTLSPIAEGAIGFDGVARLDNGTLLASNYEGGLYWIGRQGRVEAYADALKPGVSTNDLARLNDLVVVANLNANSATALTLTFKSMDK